MQYEEACSRGAVTTEQFKQIMANASASAKEYAIETKGVAGSTDVFVNKQKESISAMQASAKATVGTGTALKTLGRTLVSMGAYTLIFTVISKVVGLAATAIDNYVHRVEKANDAMDEAVSTYEETKSELENINSELDANAQKIDELKSKGELTYVEQGQLEQLEAATKQLELQKDILAKTEIVKSYLAEYELSSEDFTVQSPSITDNSMNPYMDKNQVRYTYIAETVVLVRSSKVEQVKKAQGDSLKLMSDGIAVSKDYKSKISFEFTKLNDIKPQMIAEATKNARTAAEQFARDSGSKVGKIKRASQGLFSIEDAAADLSERKTIRVVTTVEYLLK